MFVRRRRRAVTVASTFQAVQTRPLPRNGPVDARCINNSGRFLLRVAHAPVDQH